MSHPVVFELCAETLEACLSAKPGSANRIELCSALDVGGLTPVPHLAAQVIQQSGLPVNVLLRPHASGFNYSTPDFETICNDLQTARKLGASGVVLGILHADRTIDQERTRILVEKAFPLEVTFHRAFDEVEDLDQALEDVIATGCHRILTSGGAPDVLAGADVLARLIARASGRIQIAVGGGLRLENAAEVAHITGAHHFHGSVPMEDNTGSPAMTFAEHIQTMVRTLNDA